jgi:23S rRNA (cytidine1920-2'-O)/16S rRNA (cytidine1409-2'-O)-methyltransferase
MVSPDDPIAIAGPATRFASRGGDKLDSAIERLHLDVAGKRWMDAGASTGGFTDRLLQGGATGVVAVDVGYGQLDWKIRNDERVVVLERTNVRKLTAGDLPWRPEGVVADLSFISLTLVIAVLADLATPEADHVLLVKPQFEVGKEAVGKGGVVRDPELWQGAIEKVVAAGGAHGLGLVGTSLAEPPGPAGNREFFVHMRRGPGDASSIQRAVEDALR